MKIQNVCIVAGLLSLGILTVFCGQGSAVQNPQETFALPEPVALPDDYPDSTLPAFQDNSEADADSEEVIMDAEELSIPQEPGLYELQETEPADSNQNDNDASLKNEYDQSGGLIEEGAESDEQMDLTFPDTYEQQEADEYIMDDNAPEVETMYDETNESESDSLDLSSPQDAPAEDFDQIPTDPDFLPEESPYETDTPDKQY